MDGRGERKARINYRSNVARLEQSRERKKKEKGEEDQGCALSLSRNAVHRMVSGEEENAWNWTREGKKEEFLIPRRVTYFK